MFELSDPASNEGSSLKIFALNADLSGANWYVRRDFGNPGTCISTAPVLIGVVITPSASAYLMKSTCATWDYAAYDLIR